MYDLSDVSKYFAKDAGQIAALEHVTLQIPDGEFLAIQGPTGQGKTTLLQLLGGLDRPSNGRIVFDGVDLTTMSEADLTEFRGKVVGFVFQTFNLIPTLNALENVETALVPLRVPAPERRARAQRVLADLGLDDRATHFPGELSGGQQQRVAIGRALVKEPKVLLADEPTGNLDEETRDEIVDLLEHLWHDRGLTVIIVTHDSAVARRAQRLALIRHGRLSIRASELPRA
jgi:putative ABC transport system ATP-binding protein